MEKQFRAKAYESPVFETEEFLSVDVLAGSGDGTVEDIYNDEYNGWGGGGLLLKEKIFCSFSSPF